MLLRTAALAFIPTANATLITSGQIEVLTPQTEAGAPNPTAGGLVRITIGEAPKGYTANRTLDATGLIVCPGLVDLAARSYFPELLRAGVKIHERPPRRAGRGW